MEQTEASTPEGTGTASTAGAPANVGMALEAFLPYRLSVLANTVSNAMADLYAERFGLSIPEWRVMAVLARFPGSSAQALVSHTRMDKVAISRSVKRLAGRGLLRRVQSDRDKRRSQLSLNEEGMAIYGSVVPLARAYETRLLESLSTKRATLLDELLTELQATADRLLAETEAG